jgi:hypothetical protein
MLRQIGAVRHPQCSAGPASKSKCRLCPKLFPTWPVDQPLGTMSRAEIRQKTQAWAKRVGDPDYALYSGISLRRAGCHIWTAAKMDNAMVKRHMRLAVGMTGVYGDYTTAQRLKPSRCVHESLIKNQQPKRRDDNDELCDVCGKGPVPAATNPLYCCDGTGCRVVRHHKCTGLRHVLRTSVSFYCTRCAQR